MARIARQLTPNQQELLTGVREARMTLVEARKSKPAEIDRRAALLAVQIAEAEARLAEEKRNIAAAKARLAAEVEDDINLLEIAFDDALLAAVEAGVPIRRIAIDALGTPHDASVRRMIFEAQADGRENVVSGNSLIPKPPESPRASLPVGGPRFTLVDADYTLYDDGAERYSAPTVLVELDPLDPWIGTMLDKGIKGSPDLTNTVCTMYRNPGTGQMRTLEDDPGSEFYTHLAARWVKEHQAEAASGYDAVLARA